MIDGRQQCQCLRQAPSADRICVAPSSDSPLYPISPRRRRITFGAGCLQPAAGLKTAGSKVICDILWVLLGISIVIFVVWAAYVSWLRWRSRRSKR
jgi:hypothetical protein